MSEDLEYRIIPQKVIIQPIPAAVKIPLTDEEEEKIRKSQLDKMEDPGCIFPIICSVIILLVGMYKLSFNWLFLLLVAFIGGGGVWCVDFYIKHDRAWKIAQSEIAEKEQEKAEQAKLRIEQGNQKEISRADYNAKALTSELKIIYTRSMSLVPEMKQHLNHASSWLRQAQNEYNSNAFAPFWDAVENAAGHLALFNDKAEELSKNADEYYRKLNNVEHTFPVFPVKIGTIPDASPVVNEFRQTVRLGQTNFQFANIWEHRMTREVLLAGFRTLGEAVNNLGWSIESSVSSLKRSISSDIAKVVDEHIKTRDVLDQRMLEQNRMLDNIQHHRKP